MENNIKKLSSGLFGIAVICFFFPFISVSCQGQKLVTLTGVQLAVGTTISEPPTFGQPKEHPIGSEPLVVLALSTGVIGLGFSFLKGRRIALLPAVAGGIGVISLLLIKSKFDNELLKSGGGMFQIEYGIGYWLTFLLFFSAVGANVTLFIKSNKKGSMDQVPPE